MKLYWWDIFLFHFATLICILDSPCFWLEPRVWRTSVCLGCHLHRANNLLEGHEPRRKEGRKADEELVGGGGVMAPTSNWTDTMIARGGQIARVMSLFVWIRPLKISWWIYNSTKAVDICIGSLSESILDLSGREWATSLLAVMPQH